ncbi:MAG: DUF2834 domain-containing protein [Verrucomicrobiota bacterium JB022]|nr:DUF2834 domain-containing protein [Verrucomicrobiota bacterium JB022]
MRSKIYLVLCLFGLIVPMLPFVHWLGSNGLNVEQFWHEIVISRVASFAWLDVVFTALALLAWIAFGPEKDTVRGSGLAVVATLLVGPSCGLPFYLYLRERSKIGLPTES